MQPVGSLIHREASPALNIRFFSENARSATHIDVTGTSRSRLCPLASVLPEELSGDSWSLYHEGPNVAHANRLFDSRQIMSDSRSRRRVARSARLNAESLPTSTTCIAERIPVLRGVSFLSAAIQHGDFGGPFPPHRTRVTPELPIVEPTGGHHEAGHFPYGTSGI